MSTNHDHPCNSLDRRSVLCRIARASAWAASAAFGFNALSSLAYAATQDNWRMCEKCNMLFYHGYRKSICPAGGRHAARMSTNYVLPYDVPEGPHAQGAWRFCNRCESLFFVGYTPKGVCPAGQGHVAQGFVFVLPHEVSDRGSADKDWRYCTKCHALFYDHRAEKGRCAAGGGHTADGFNFVLRFHGNLEGDVELHPAQK